MYKLCISRRGGEFQYKIQIKRQSESERNDVTININL